MKRLFLSLAIVALLCGCATTQPGTAPASTQGVATVIRQAETLALTPAEFAAAYDYAARWSPGLAAHASDVKAEYARLYALGQITLPALETLAARYDTK